MSQVNLLAQNAPSWATIDQLDSTSFNCVAKLNLSEDAYHLSVTLKEGIVNVGEKTPGLHFPAACPERHINLGGSFCIGLAIGGSVTDASTAKNWWEHLKHFLRHQDFAERRKFWPRGKGLSHGMAAISQLEMEKIAKGLDDKKERKCQSEGWLQEVRDAIELQDGWLANELPRIRKNSTMLVNQRCPCPRGCATRKRWIKRRRCPERETIASLIFYEAERRQREREFFDDLRNKNFICCGKMKTCPLKEENNK